ncbi:WXG100 family type VII secretion target [Paenibacillus sp. USHLN196]|uniref:WXG100 family type VII secretion target n=1 Tax=Paenibacillus sp. USHLN196 TaxID=3081291 RepID=UPI00301667B9
MNQRIDLSPEELQQLAGEFNKASQNGQDILAQLKTMIDQSEGQWEGERQREFLGRMNDSMTNISHYLRGLQETSTSLQQTATRFRDTDQSR